MLRNAGGFVVSQVGQQRQESLSGVKSFGLVAPVRNGMTNKYRIKICEL
jgi:hypothetical protein